MKIVDKITLANPILKFNSGFLFFFYISFAKSKSSQPSEHIAVSYVEFLKKLTGRYHWLVYSENSSTDFFNTFEKLWENFFSDSSG